jgi:menaquinone-dependent protoporphyrinogen IX oxidase
MLGLVLSLIKTTYILCSNVRTIFVLYGSQTGNSEFIANDLAAKFTDTFTSTKDPSAGELNIEVRCCTLNTAKKTDLKAEAAAVVIGASLRAFNAV